MTDEDSCRSVEIYSQMIRVRGARDLTEEDREALKQILIAARRKFEHEDALRRLTEAGVIGRIDCKVRRQD